MTQVQLDQFNNDAYRPGPVVRRSLWYLVSLVFFDNGLPWPSSLRTLWLALFGAELGRGIVIKPRVRIKYPWKLKIGNHSWVGEGVWIDNLDVVSIGNHCCVSQGAYLLCGNHNYKKASFDLMTAPIRMENGSWAGAQSILAPGAILGEEAMLTAGSVGLGELAERQIHQGNPAKPVRNRVIEP